MGSTASQQHCLLDLIAASWFTAFARSSSTDLSSSSIIACILACSSSTVSASLCTNGATVTFSLR